MAEKAAKKPNFLVRFGRGVARFFRDTRGEMKKVVWPSKKQVLNNLAIVLAFVLLCAVIIFVLDIAFAWLFKASTTLAGNIGTEATSEVVSSAVQSAAAKLPFIFTM